MDVLESNEWEAVIRIPLSALAPEMQVLIYVDVPEEEREEARDSVDLRPFVRVRPAEPCPVAALEQARDMGLVAMLGKQASSSA